MQNDLAIDDNTLRLQIQRWKNLFLVVDSGHEFFLNMLYSRRFYPYNLTIVTNT